MICKECGKEKVWMEYTEVWACPDDCTGSYAVHSLTRLGMNLTPNPKFKSFGFRSSEKSIDGNKKRTEVKQ